MYYLQTYKWILKTYYALRLIVSIKGDFTRECQMCSDCSSQQVEGCFDFPTCHFSLLAGPGLLPRSPVSVGPLGTAVTQSLNPESLLKQDILAFNQARQPRQVRKMPHVLARKGNVDSGLHVFYNVTCVRLEWKMGNRIHVHSSHLGREFMFAHNQPLVFWSYFLVQEITGWFLYVPRQGMEPTTLAHGMTL